MRFSCDLYTTKMHKKFFYKPDRPPQWSEERQFDNVEEFHKYANTAGNFRF